MSEYQVYDIYDLKNKGIVVIFSSHQAKDLTVGTYLQGDFGGIWLVLEKEKINHFFGTDNPMTVGYLLRPISGNQTPKQYEILKTSKLNVMR